MPFVRKKVNKGRTYHYLVECLWKDGKPRQKVICYLGRFATVRGAHAHWIREAAKSKDKAAQRHAKQMVKTLKQYVRTI
jgi:hypothetical protein